VQCCKHGLDRFVAVGQQLIQQRQALGRHMVRRYAGIDAVRSSKPRPGQRDITADFARQPRQGMGSADIGDQPNAGFRHCEQRALGGNPVTTMDRQPNPAAHGDSIKDRDIRVRIGRNRLVHAVFVVKEVLPLTAAGTPGMVHADDVAAGTESPVAGPVDDHQRNASVADAVV